MGKSHKNVAVNESIQSLTRSLWTANWKAEDTSLLVSLSQLWSPKCVSTVGTGNTARNRGASTAVQRSPAWKAWFILSTSMDVDKEGTPKSGGC